MKAWPYVLITALAWRMIFLVVKVEGLGERLATLEKRSPPVAESKEERK